MANINFKTNALNQLYIHGTADGSNSAQVHLNYFRNNTTTTLQDEISQLDRRIANFQNVITDGAKAGSEEFPYDKAYLKREFMEEVLAIMLKRSEYRNPFSNPVYISSEGDLLAFGSAGANFSDMSQTQHESFLKTGIGEGGVPVYRAYSAWIDAVFEEGNKIKNNPIDAGTGQTVVSKVTTSIAERVIGGKTYDRVSYDGANYYLIEKGASTTGTKKVNVIGSTLEPADSYIGFTEAPKDATFLLVDENLNPLSSTPIVSPQPKQRLMSPVSYLYYWTEARVKVLRGQLNMKEAVTSEIRDDLLKANAAYADLETQAGRTRAQSADGKTVNPDLSYETSTMDFFEATNAKRGDTIYDNTGSDDAANYAEWGSSRSALKAYIDRKSTQSQDAMLDYQTTLNRFNQAYEVMSKLQEKMDGLLKSQIRNVG